MRKAFTLIELLAVIGIVGMLGVAAAASYGALVTGMRDRSACAAATAVLREACERARIDRLPTVVYCYNVCLKESKADDPGRVVGLMTAIRRVGRITQVKGRYLFDEFADLDQSYRKMESEAELREMDGFRLFKYNDESSVQSRMQYSITLPPPTARMPFILFSRAVLSLYPRTDCRNLRVRLRRESPCIPLLSVRKLSCLLFRI